jgi:regulator of sigma E protease
VSTDFLHSVLSNIWVVFLVVLLFGGSIFVHELGHFLAARRRGAKVDRFSIGFGPAIWSWHGRDGVEYRISWFPLGGYVLLPQLADLGMVEGESRYDAGKLPPVSYTTKMIVFAAGAVFNVLFAFVLACVVWAIGISVEADITTTTIAEVLPKIEKSDGVEVDGPAYKAGLRAGDTLVAIDGSAVETFDDVVEKLTLSSGWKDGERHTIFTVRRGDQTLEIAVEPVLAGLDRTRKVGISPVSKVIVGEITSGSLAAEAGLRTDDQIVAVEGKPIMTVQQFIRAVRARSKPLPLTVTRGGNTIELTLATPRPNTSPLDFGMDLKTKTIHPNPFRQIADSALKTYQAVAGLLNRKSDIGLRQMSGPVGIIKTFYDASRLGLPVALWFTILVNVNLAILNLLPVPVLDGGQMLFATIARLRGRALPTNFVLAAQSVFFVLIFAMIGYITIVGDLPRLTRERRRSNAPHSTPGALPSKGPTGGAGPPVSVPAGRLRAAQAGAPQAITSERAIDARALANASFSRLHSAFVFPCPTVRPVSARFVGTRSRSRSAPSASAATTRFACSR